MNKERYQLWKRFVSLILTICLTVGQRGYGLCVDWSENRDR